MEGSKSPAKEQIRRLTYKERQELAALPKRIELLESEIATLHEAMADPEFYQQSGEQLAAEQARLTGLERQLATAYERWEELEQFG